MKVQRCDLFLPWNIYLFFFILFKMRLIAAVKVVGCNVMKVSFKVYVSFQIQINIINSHLTILSRIIILGLTKLKLKMRMRRIVWPGGERSELGCSLGPFLLPSPLFSLPRSPIYIFLLFRPVFCLFPPLRSPVPGYVLLLGRWGVLSSK